MGTCMATSVSAWSALGQGEDGGFLGSLIRELVAFDAYVAQKPLEAEMPVHLAELVERSITLSNICYPDTHGTDLKVPEYRL